MDIRIPHLGEGADTGTVVSIFVKEGDRVSKDQTIVELENEKAVAPIPSTSEGVVEKILVKVGDKVSVGQAIVRLAGSGGSAAPAASQAPAPKASAPAPQAHAAPASQTPAPSGEYYYESAAGLAPPASPTIRRVAQDLGIDLRRVRGSEAGGRISMGDLRDYVQMLQQRAFQSAPAAASAPAAKAAAEKIDFSKWGPVTKKPVSSLRQKIGQKMSESWSTAPHVTQFDEADITALMALRKKHAPSYEKKGAALTITPFVMKAVVQALKKYPQFNSSLDADGALVLKQYYHLGIAVDTEQGLIVPVLKDADKKTLLEIAKELGELAEKTRARKVSVDDLKGGTFTISNLGSIGGGPFTPIINVPEVAILGIGRGALKPVVVKTKEKESIEARLLMPLALSYDHRVIDGADGARFIREVAGALEGFPEKEIKL